eukprot:TRINITY_DN60017_c0_g1_i1.p1 TRINITY_DN60017_c0_g1~~TRINITY_DN60017_c0_g1_i1.p1  ORF type:complete len:453 (+),score=97.87 TRINITY_DN60017_c0_g1_i1:65-1423(+)
MLRASDIYGGNRSVGESTGSASDAAGSSHGGKGRHRGGYEERWSGGGGGDGGGDAWGGDGWGKGNSWKGGGGGPYGMDGGWGGGCGHWGGWDSWGGDSWGAPFAYPIPTAAPGGMDGMQTTMPPPDMTSMPSLPGVPSMAPARMSGGLQAAGSDMPVEPPAAPAPPAAPPAPKGEGKGSRKGKSGAFGNAAAAASQRKGGAGPSAPAPPKPLPSTVVLVTRGFKISPGFEEKIEEAVREVAISNAHSCADQVRYITSGSAFIDFPSIDVAKFFMDVTKGQLTIGAQTFHLTMQNYTAPGATEGSSLASKDDSGDSRPEPGPAVANPTDTLLIRNIWDLKEEQIHEAFQSYVPLIKSTNIPKNNKDGKKKPFAFVRFYSISEAKTALDRFHASGSLIGKQKVDATFSQPQTNEDAARQSQLRQAEDARIKENTEQALNGVNANMWAEYLKMFK